MDKYEIVLTFQEPLLGTAPLNPEVYGEWIATRNPNGAADDEMESVEWSEEAEIEKGTTGFHRIDGAPMLYDYHVKGFFKDACGMLRRDTQSGSAKLKAYKKIIDGLVFVEPRRIPIQMAGEITFLERPLRAQTAQGERIALARSESIPAGSSIKFFVLTLGKDVSEATLREWLEYGTLRGMGQWRNASYGRFSYELAKR